MAGFGKGVAIVAGIGILATILFDFLAGNTKEQKSPQNKTTSENQGVQGAQTVAEQAKQAQPKTEMQPEPTLKDVAGVQGVNTKDFVQKTVGDALRAQQLLMKKDSVMKEGISISNTDKTFGAQQAVQKLADTAVKTQQAGGKLPSGVQASATSLNPSGQFGAGVVTARAKQQATAVKSARKR